jgi:hypothetical protein
MISVIFSGKLPSPSFSNTETLKETESYKPFPREFPNARLQKRPLWQKQGVECHWGPVTRPAGNPLRGKPTASMPVVERTVAPENWRFMDGISWKRQLCQQKDVCLCEKMLEIYTVTVIGIESMVDLSDKNN